MKKVVRRRKTEAVQRFGFRSKIESSLAITLGFTLLSQSAQWADIRLVMGGILVALAVRSN